MPSPTVSPRRLTPAGPSCAWRACATGLAILAAGAACTDAAGVTDPGTDRIAPTVKVAAGTGADSTLAFSVTANDNLGLKTIKVRVTGGVVADTTITFTSANTNVTLPFDLSVPSTVPPGTGVMIVAMATDGAYNSSAPDTLQLAVGNTAPPAISFVSPASGASVVVGKSIGLAISARSVLKVKAVGYEATGVLTMKDSTFTATPNPDTTVVLDTLAIPAQTQAGELTLTPFIIDGSGQRVPGSAIVLAVKTAASSSSTPSVTMQASERVELADSVTVSATDEVGVTTIGYAVYTADNARAQLSRDSVTLDGTFSTPNPVRFGLALPSSLVGQRVILQGFAWNANARSADAAPDTVTVVAGSTIPLTQGGRIADAIYYPAGDRLYLTNIERNRLEVFDLATQRFATAISVGSRPWGVAAWPSDRDGTMANKLIVANSGGTNLSFVDLLTGTEYERYALPNIIVSTVTTVLSSTTGQPMQQYTVHDFSDRPQYVAATCQGPATGPAPCGDVLVVYSTTPTGGQTTPFAKQGTIRWENVTDGTSHFFFEQAMGQSEGRSDTLAIDRYDPVTGAETSLVPAVQTMTAADGDTAKYSVVVRIDQLGFRDTTYVRNSASFRRVVIGEGGEVRGSRAMMYDVTRGLDSTTTDAHGSVATLPVPVEDAGVSGPFNVSDWIANTFSQVRGVAINRDGALAAIRADSTYIIDAGLRLQGLLQTSGGNAGFDFHPCNTGLNSATGRLAYAASSEPRLEVYDTYNYQKLQTIEIRDPIIGPIKSVLRSGSVMLIGATARGVVTVSLPDPLGTSCS